MTDDLVPRLRHAPPRTGDSRLIKDLNSHLVLDKIQREGPISRTQIAAETGLSLSAVSKLVAGWQRAGIVHEIGKEESRGGRRPVLLEFDYHSGLAVGIKLSVNRMVSVIVDLEGHVQATDKRAFRPGNLEETVEQIVEALEALLEPLNAADRGRVLGVGIGLAGWVDPNRGTLVRSEFLPLSGAPLRDRLIERVGMPVHLDNDANTFTVAQRWLGEGQSVENFICVTIGNGIGAGIIIDGKLYHGASGGAGEFGHIPIRPHDGPICGCGRRGCLEALASESSILRDARAALAAGTPSSLREAVASPADLTIEHLIEAADAGDELARGLYQEAGRMLGQGVAILVNLFNPEEIILGGEGSRGLKYYLEGIERTLADQVVYGLQDEVRLVCVSLGEETWAVGAATLVPKDVYSSPLHRGR